MNHYDLVKFKRREQQCFKYYELRVCKLPYGCLFHVDILVIEGMLKIIISNIKR